MQRVKILNLNKCLHNIRSFSVKLAYDVVEHGNSKKDLVIFHGLFGSKRNWRPFGSKLTNFNKVYTVDIRNHGESPHVNSMNFYEMCDDVQHFFETHQLEKPIILGHSFGGRLAMIFAIKHPELLSALISVDVLLRESPFLHKFVRYFEAMARIDMSSITAENFSKMRGQTAKQLSSVIKDKTELNFIMTNMVWDDEIGAAKWKLNVSALLQDFLSVISVPSDLQQHWSEQKMREFPAHFIFGKKSEYYEPKHFGSHLHRWFPKAEVSVIAGADHWVHADKPAEFSALVNSLSDSFC